MTVIRSSIARISSVQLIPNLLLNTFEQKHIMMPADLDIFRVQLQIAISGVVTSVVNTAGLPVAIVNTSPITNNRNGWRISCRRYDNTGNSFIYYESETLLLDRRGTDSYMTDDLYVALFWPGFVELRANQQMVCNVIMEGYQK